MFCCVVLYCTVLHCTALHCTALYCTVLHCIVLYCIALHCIALHCIVLYCIVLYCVVCIADLEISDPLQEVFSIPYNAANETYACSFQDKLLNNILFTNTKLFKIGLNVLSAQFTKKTYTISFMTALIRVSFGTDFAMGGLIFGVKI